jgi:uncharacterized membrane protein YdjX (TVP38/TMEM64 family)
MRPMPATKGPLKAQHIAGLAVLSIVTLIGFASPFIPADFAVGLEPWLAAAKANAWAPLAAMLGFALFASIGVPQIVLITAVVAVFGPWFGLVYSWTGKMAACSFGFFIGRRFGARIVAANAGPRLSEFMRMLARRGFMVSALIRVVPTLPSVLINIAAGATPIRFRDFLGGTALGSVPKMALMAFGGAAAMEAMRADSIWPWLVLGAVLLLWALLAWAARTWMRAAKQSESL